MKACRVSFTDGDRIKHTVEVQAESLFEAVGLAIVLFRRSDYFGCDPVGHTEFTVEAREPSTEDRVTRMQFNEWLNRQSRSPREMSVRRKIREAIEGHAQ